ncbi:MAG TPA: phenylalanine--tRNA ligase subunit beta, partial [Acholeplasma sp.]|nr:phenylalanine--tRNA ligase subunit beta [Acholeplasma sp.]
YEPVSKFPSVERDLSFIVSREIPIQKILTLIQQTGKKLITNVKLFDIYQKPGEDTHSLAVSIEFNDKEKTLEKETVEKVLKSIKNRLSFEFKAIIRD